MADTPAFDEASDPTALAAKFERHRHLLPAFADADAADAAPTWPALAPDAARDRARGCLLGLAVGEALGSIVEFLPRNGFAPVAAMTGGGPLQLAPGEWTDGTAMALCLADTLVADATVEQYEFMTRLRAWLEQGERTPRGQALVVGATTRAAIERFAQDDEPAAGSPDGATAGNGSLIRLAPLAIFAAGHAEVARFWSGKQSRATHATIECLDACELFTAQLVDALAGADKAAVLRPRVMQLAPNTLAIDGGEFKTKSRDDVRASAYVVDTLDAALWAVWHADDFRGAVLAAVDLGGDAAGVAAVAGQLAGALYGASSIPPEWLAALAWRERLETTADELVRFGATAF